MSNANNIYEMGQLLILKTQEIDREFGPFSSPHAAYGVLMEEVCEFFEEVRKKRAERSALAMRNECLDIAAVALRYATQLQPECEQ